MRKKIIFPKTKFFFNFLRKHYHIVKKPLKVSFSLSHFHKIYFVQMIFGATLFFFKELLSKQNHQTYWDIFEHNRRPNASSCFALHTQKLVEQKESLFSSPEIHDKFILFCWSLTLFAFRLGTADAPSRKFDILSQLSLDPNVNLD